MSLSLEWKRRLDVWRNELPKHFYRSLGEASLSGFVTPQQLTWSQQAYLKASNTGTDDAFGESVAVSGDTVVVGARDEASNATGINGNQSDNSATNAGAAYVFGPPVSTYLPLIIKN